MWILKFELSLGYKYHILSFIHFLKRNQFFKAHSKDLIYFSNHLLGAFEGDDKMKIIEVICNRHLKSRRAPQLQLELEKGNLEL